jgi:CDGSH-type Zn-finger protein
VGRAEERSHTVQGDRGGRACGLRRLSMSGLFLDTEQKMADQENDGRVEILVRDNGSLRVTGPIRLVDADGNEFDLGGKNVVSLCRCGGSTRKPFCDGTHSKIGFAGAERAVREAQQ